MNPTKQSGKVVQSQGNSHSKNKGGFEFRLSEILFLLILSLCFCYVVEAKGITVNNLDNLPPLSASGDRQGNQSRSAKSSFGTTSDAEEETPLGPVAMGDKLSLMCDEWCCFFS